MDFYNKLKMGAFAVSAGIGEVSENRNDHFKDFRQSVLQYRNFPDSRHPLILFRLFIGTIIQSNQLLSQFNQNKKMKSDWLLATNCLM